MMPKMMLTMMPMMFDEIRAIMAAQGKEIDLTEIMPTIIGPFMSGMLEVVPAERMVEHKEVMFGRMFEQREDLRTKIPERQMEMMPGCMRRLMENISYDEKVQYAEHILGILVEKGSENLSEDQRADYLARLRAAVAASATSADR
jgi:hypothetical protein